MVGSTAAAAWGTARMTRDVDIVVLLVPDSGETVLEALNVLDVSYMHRWAAELGVQDDLTELLAEQT